MNGEKTTRAIVWAVVALTVVVVAAVVLLEVFAPERASDSVSQVLGVLAPTVAVLATLRAVATVQGSVERVQEDTHALTNGLLDSKVRAGVAEVLPDHLVDPDYREGGGLHEDESRRAAADRPRP